MNMKVTLGDLVLRNPVTVASGTAGYGEELSDYIDLSEIGAIFTKGLSLEPRKGNRGNRVIETPSGMLNSIGLENVGLEVFLNDKLPFILEREGVPIPNVAGHTEEENVELCRILSRTTGINAVELNVSCPNVKEGGMAFGTNIESFTSLVRKVRETTDCALIVKLSPNVTDVTLFARKAEELGVDALSAVNTFLGMHIDTKRKRLHFNNGVAGQSGPAIRPMALRVVYQVAGAVSLPVIGMGGISTLNDALQFFMAGASALSLGTINLVYPDRAARLVKELEEYGRKEGLSSIKDIIGAARPRE